MAYTTQYIGSRYVPLFAEPAEWDSTRTYEPLTIVIHDGNSYTSRQYVPVGIKITNEKFWALTGNYNAQVEAYRQEVRDNTATTNIYKDKAEKAIEDVNKSEADYKKSTDDAITQYKSETDTAINNYKSETDTAINNYKSETDTAINNYKSETDTAINNYKSETDTAINNFYDKAKTDFAGYTPFDTSPTDNSSKGVTSDGVYNYIRKQNLIVIGDSFGAGYLTQNGGFPNRINNKVYNVTNLSESGAGIIHVSGSTNNRFIDIVNKQSVDSSIDIVVLEGGYNDRNNLYESTDNLKVFQNTFAAIHTKWPKAKVYFFMNNGSMRIDSPDSAHVASASWTKTQEKNLATAITQSGLQGYAFIDMTHYLLGLNQYFANDYIHPNDNGQLIWANAIINTLEGNAPSWHYTIDNKKKGFDLSLIAGDVDTSKFSISKSVKAMDNGIICIDAKITKLNKVEYTRLETVMNNVINDNSYKFATQSVPGYKQSFASFGDENCALYFDPQNYTLTMKMGYPPSKTSYKYTFETLVYVDTYASLNA